LKLNNTGITPLFKLYASPQKGGACFRRGGVPTPYENKKKTGGEGRP